MGIAAQVMENVENMGKQQNPVTGSGGMLLGKIADIGPNYTNSLGLKPGDDVCTLVSLTLTPLVIDKIREVHMSEQISKLTAVTRRLEKDEGYAGRGGCWFTVRSTWYVVRRTPYAAHRTLNLELILRGTRN